MSERIWFQTQRFNIVDLNLARSFYYKNESEKKVKIKVYMDYLTSGDIHTLAEFDNEDDAKDYIVKIRHVLWEHPQSIY